MSKFIKGLLVIALAAFVFTGAAEARGGHGGGGHGGGWHGGGWGGAYWGPYPYYYGPGYYGPGGCGWARVRAWRGGYWVVRRVWRCW
jgi:hypothetical protein